MAKRRVIETGPTEEERRKGLRFARGMAQYVVWLSQAADVERPEPKEMSAEQILVLADEFPDHPLTFGMREGAEVALGRKERMLDFWERQEARSGGASRP